MPDARSHALPRAIPPTLATPARDRAAEIEVSLEREMRAHVALTHASDALPGTTLSLHRDLGALEALWRAFEAHASCTGFQTFDWLSKAQACVGAKRGEIPVVVLGRNAEGAVLFLFPFAVAKRRAAKHLTWLAAEMCDYNTPLLGPGFPEAMPETQFLSLWREIVALIRREPALAFDVTDLTKMPERVGVHANPFRALSTNPNPSGAHVCTIGTDWEALYAARRSKDTRKREGRQLKALQRIGDVRFVEPEDEQGIVRTLETLYDQKARSFARMGVENIFDRPGYKDFFTGVAKDPKTRGLVKVSRLDVGDIYAGNNLGIQFHGNYYNVLTSYYDGLEMIRLGPGRFHLHQMLKKAIADGCKTFDMTIGDEGYKRTWADIELTLYDHLQAQTARGWLVVQYFVWLRKLKRFIKQTPAVWRAYTFARALKSKLTGAGQPAAEAE